jgi:putative membrane protein
VLHVILISIWLAAFAWSGHNPRDRFTWVLEVLPAVGLLVGVAITCKRFPLTPMLYMLITLHCVVLMIGGKYTYAEVPAFNWLRDEYHLARNYYDRVGHFMQGFVPALITREVLIRLNVLNRRGWLPFFVVSICLAMSAFYEFIEWWVALATGESAAAFLGTQGDPWDTQWDMFTCFVGSIVALAAMSRIQDRQIGRIEPTPKSAPRPPKAP